jgi:RNA-directed DNA polymerase
VPIKVLIKTNAALPTDKLIYLLNPKIRGWAEYYKGVVSSKTFAKVDHEIFCALWRWRLKRHANKGKRWIVKKYFTTHENNHWRFHCPTKDREGITKPLLLRRARETHIRRHTKIKAEANLFNPEFKEYFIQRAQRKRKRTDKQGASSAGPTQFGLFRA